MGNAIEYECDSCHYWEAIHGQNGFFITQERFKKCSNCTKPNRDRLAGHGIYPPNEGGFKIEED
jgi:hypothetical protein